ncbi:MAG: acyl carrier protein [Magnetospirillum sp.]|nr:acyl carrier protein [Magnetospirillum sp.]
MMADETDEVAARIAGLAAERVPHRGTVAGETRIRELGLDSVALMDLIMAVEDQFDLIFPLERLSEVETVDDLARVVRTLVQERMA